MRDKNTAVIFELRRQFKRLEDNDQERDDICSYVVATLSYYCNESAKNQKYKELYFNLLKVFESEDIEQSKKKVEEFLIKEEAYTILQGLQQKEINAN